MEKESSSREKHYPAGLETGSFQESEIKRRLNSIGRHPDEEGCLALVYRVCTQYQQKKYGFKADDLVQALWKKLREQKIEMIKQLELDLEAA